MEHNANLTRELVRTGGTNPDYAITLADSIIAETKRDNWDSAYMIGKAKSIITFLECEQRRANSIEEQGHTEKTIKEYRAYLYKQIPKSIIEATIPQLTKMIMVIRPMLDIETAKLYAYEIRTSQTARICNEATKIIYDIIDSVKEKDK